MKRLTFLVICLVLLLLAVPGLSAPIAIKFPHTYLESSPVGRGANLFKVLAESRLKSKVKVDIYPARQLGNTKQIMEALQSGAVQIAPLPLYRLAELSQQFQVFALPFLFEDEGAVYRFQRSHVTKTLLDAAEKEGYKGLDFWHFGMKQLMADKPLLLPTDAKGLKFAVSKSVFPDLAMWQYKAIDAAPVLMSANQIYCALQGGGVDGLEDSWPSLFYSKFYEAKKYISVTNHAYIGFLLTANTGFWRSLPSDIRHKLQTIIPEVTKEVNRLAVEESFKAIQGIKKSGAVQIKTLTNEERAEWLKYMKPVWNKLESRIGSEIVQTAIQKSGTGGGGDPCPLGTCRCMDRSCKKKCCY